MKSLHIGQIDLPKGFRCLVPQSAEFLKKTGLTVVNGGSGKGKSSLLEVLKVATEGKDALRDKYFIREGQDESEIMVQIGCEEDAALNFFICAKLKQSGEVAYSFKVEVDGKLKATKSLPEIGDITPSKLFDMISTTLTYGAADFMSENPKTVREFIFKTYPEVRDVAKEIDQRIQDALTKRDAIAQQQSAIGAYANKLDDKTCPEYIDVSKLVAKRSAIIEELSDAKATDKAFAANVEQSINAKAQELENVKLKAEDVKRRIADWNTARQEEFNKSIQDYVRLIDNYEDALSNMTIAFRVFYPSAAHQLLEDLLAPFKAIVQNTIALKDQLPEAFQINDRSNASEMPDKESKGLVTELETLRKQYGKLDAEIKAMKAQEVPANPESKVEEINERLRLVDIEIANAEESNDLWTKFDVLQNYKDANDEVIALRAERNKLYESIDTGVKGLKISLTDEAGTMLGFFYDGSYNPEYFSNPNAEIRPITSYSKSQKTLVAAILQCFLMKRKPYALNVVCIDDTGMDSVVYNLYDKFAQKHGLLMFVTNTNDKTEKDLREGEVLIEEGEVIVKAG